MADARKLYDEIEQMIQDAGEIHRGLDANDDGTVTTAEVMNAWKNKKSHATGHQADLYQQLIDNIGEVDKNNDNKISFVEFMRFYDKLKVKYGKN